MPEPCWVDSLPHTQQVDCGAHQGRTGRAHRWRHRQRHTCVPSPHAAVSQRTSVGWRSVSSMRSALGPLITVGVKGTNRSWVLDGHHLRPDTGADRAAFTGGLNVPPCQGRSAYWWPSCTPASPAHRAVHRCEGVEASAAADRDGRANRWTHGQADRQGLGAVTPCRWGSVSNTQTPSLLCVALRGVAWRCVALRCVASRRVALCREAACVVATRLPAHAFTCGAKTWDARPHTPHLACHATHSDRFLYLFTLSHG